MSITIGGDGAARVSFTAPAGLHRVADEACIASLAYQLTEHIGTAWVAAVALSSGHGVMRVSNARVVWPDKQTQALMVGIVIAINQYEARRGHWVVAFNAAEQEVVALWRDADGDVHAVWEIGPPAKLMDWKALDFASQAAAALDQTKQQHDKVGLHHSEMSKRALRRHRHH